MSDKHDKHPNEEMLQAFLDGELPTRKRRRIEAHVSSCVRCTQELAGWRALFDDLDSLGAHAPAQGFQARVMAEVQAPATVPWAARVTARLRTVVTRGHAGHLQAGVLQDLADGTLTPRASARARRHLEGCATCAEELRSWSSLVERLSQLPRFEATEGFADRVMIAFDTAAQGNAASERAPTHHPALERVLAGARRMVPRTRRAWAAISGAAVTPAVTFGLLLWAVFSHPALTLQGLASFVRWQLGDLVVAAWSATMSGGLQLTRTVGLDGFVETLVEAPWIAAGGLALYAVAFTVASRVLYKNLINSRSLRPSYAPASIS